MSKMIQLRHIPDDLHRKLTARAALDGLALSDYLLHEIRKIAERPTLAELQARIARRTPVTPRETVDRAVRAERDARCLSSTRRRRSNSWSTRRWRPRLPSPRRCGGIAAARQGDHREFRGNCRATGESSRERQAHVILRERGLRRARLREVLELRESPPTIERAVAVEVVEQRGHPP